jgi:hypothetical protein
MHHDLECNLTFLNITSTCYFLHFFLPIIESTLRAQEATPSPEELWDEVGPQISAVLQNDGNIPSDVVPFDAASDRDMDEQK